MKEIKFFTHLTRNFYLYFWVYLLLLVLFNYRIDYQFFFLGILAFAIGYAPVYFVNDSQDWKEDKEEKKSNLYTTINNPVIFWLVTGFLLLFGAYLGVTISIQGYICMLLAYVLNIFHTFRTFHFRRRPLVGSVNYFVLSVIKFFIILSYLHFPISGKIIPLLIIFSSATTIALLIYKRHKQGNKFIEKAFGILFVTSAVVGSFSFPLLLVFFIPLALILLYMHYRYENTQVPVNVFQLIYLLYTFVVYGVFITK